MHSPGPHINEIEEYYGTDGLLLILFNGSQTHSALCP